ncbi:MAG: Ni/Fe-hydrogenase cytochrome b subunit [Nitrospirae bacterium]|nr:Ni/Fe-hydrogenase cytochrome b subunit [Nitrospirota bacterium]
MTFLEGVKKSFETKGMRLLLLLVSLGIVATLLRMFKGLGAVTNLTDEYPWGLWVAVDVFSGVALAAGGFTITAAVYIFNMKKYKPITRPAILTAFIGYSIVVVGLAIDIGKPFSAWHPMVYWNYRSVMFEVVMCITLYTTVLLFEFAPAFLERVKWHGALKVIKKITYPLVIAGIVLSFLHQSSLGGFYLIAPAKLNHLWWTPNLPYMFYLSAIAAGLAMVAFEGIVSTRGLKRESETEIVQGLGRGTRIALLVYLIAKIADMSYRGNWPLLLDWNKASFFWSAEILIGVLIPIALFSMKSVKESENGQLMASTLVIIGVVFNRFNMTFFTQAGSGTFYFPSIWEIFVTLGLLSAIVMFYRLAVMHLPVFHEGPLNR